MHRHSHQHDHRHGAHTHGASEQRIGFVALLTGAFMLAEVAGGLISGSLALLADAGHMVADFASLGLAWYGFRIARRPADWKRSYGYDRFTILAAFTNGLALFAIAAWIVVEAWHRLSEPTQVLGGVMLSVAIVGLAVNLIAFWVLQGGDRSSLNMRAAVLHVVGDMLGSAATLVGALVIMSTGWMAIDPILSVVVAIIILGSAWRVVRESGHILLEGAPEGLDSRQITEDIKLHVNGVSDVHHVHAWSINENRPMITLHARLSDRHAPDAVVAAIKTRLHDHFGIDHATVEIEFDDCADAKTGALRVNPTK